MAAGLRRDVGNGMERELRTCANQDGNLKAQSRGVTESWLGQSRDSRCPYASQLGFFVTKLTEPFCESPRSCEMMKETIKCKSLRGAEKTFIC